MSSHERFVGFCKFPGARMYHDHQVYSESDGVRIEHTIYVKGPLSFLWWHLVAKHVANAVAEQTDNFIQYVRVHYV